MDPDADRWMAQASEDLENAEVLMEAGRYSAGAFFAQQAAEKALKALYITEHGRLWKIHNLVTLADEVDAPEEVRTPCKELTPHYMATRYPDLAEGYDEDVVRTALSQAEEVVRWARSRL